MAQIDPIETLLLASETGLPQDSIAMCHQIRSISIQRLKEKYGEIKSQHLRDKVMNTLKI
jgi:mRNA-degrading endonuclease toxin of MazEF toxin-antitoxin module